MKKNILVILLSAGLLTGCEFDITLQRFFGKDSNETQEQQTVDSNEEKLTENNEENIDNNNETPPKDNEDNQTPTGQTDLENEYTTTIKTSGYNFSTFATAAGVQADDESFPEKVELLSNCISGQLENKNLLTKLSCEKLNTAEWKSVVYLCVGTGDYANSKPDRQFKPGTLAWTSAEKIYKVEIKAMAYAKQYQGSEFGLDKISHVWIDNDDYSLETEIEPELKTFSKTYEEGVNSFSIKSTGSRVLLESITITWKK